MTGTASAPVHASRIATEDLEAVTSRAEAAFRALDGSRLLVTGGTGFVGTWLLATLCFAADHLGLAIRAEVVTRHPVGFSQRLPHLSDHPCVHVVPGDVLSAFPEIGAVDAVIHGASVSAAAENASPSEVAGTTVAGMRHAITAARGNPLLFLSSGAVYGHQPAETARLGEEYAGAPDPCVPGAVYGEAKRTAEAIAVEEGADVKIARLFAFVGPHLPLDINFAIGNFIADAVARRPVRITGDPNTVRSYLYAGDLAAWLWTILVFGRGGRAYNVGSERAVTLLEVAQAVARSGRTPVAVCAAGNPGAVATRYVPDTSRARTELHLSQTVSLEAAVRRTVRWHETDRGFTDHR